MFASSLSGKEVHQNPSEMKFQRFENNPKLITSEKKATKRYADVFFPLSFVCVCMKSFRNEFTE